jgi:hypothetical protein
MIEAASVEKKAPAIAKVYAGPRPALAWRVPAAAGITGGETLTDSLGSGLVRSVHLRGRRTTQAVPAPAWLGRAR